MPRLLFSEILKEVQQAPTDEDKVMILESNNSIMLRQLLLAALDPNVKFNVTVPSYRENTEEDGYASNNLYVEYRRLYVFMDTYRLDLKRKSDLLEQILEGIDPSDAVALIDVINKDIAKYGVTKEIYNAAFKSSRG